MDNRTGLLLFLVVCLLFGFSFVLGNDSLANGNIAYGVLALLGYLVVISTSILNGLFAKRDGGALALWYFALVVVVSIVFVWFATRCGVAFKWW